MVIRESSDGPHIAIMWPSAAAHLRVLALAIWQVQRVRSLPHVGLAHAADREEGVADLLLPKLRRGRGRWWGCAERWRGSDRGRARGRKPVQSSSCEACGRGRVRSWHLREEVSLILVIVDRSQQLNAAGRA